MHIPDGFLNPRIWVAMDLLSGSFLAIGLRRVSRSLEEKAVPLMGVLAAFIFAAQMINIPVGGGTAGHFLGGAMVGALLGPWAGLVVMSVVLMIQCLLFQDGGLAALGANIFNMAVIGALGGAALYRLLIRIMANRRRIFWAGFLAGLVTILGSALSCTLQLVLSHVVTWSTGAYVIVGFHLLIGICEGLVTGVVLESLHKTRPDLFRFGV
jgi:cobalt/nickel transport system permease protein